MTDDHLAAMRRDAAAALDAERWRRSNARLIGVISARGQRNRALQAEVERLQAVVGRMDESVDASASQAVDAQARAEAAEAKLRDVEAERAALRARVEALAEEYETARPLRPSWRSVANNIRRAVQEPRRDGQWHGGDRAAVAAARWLRWVRDWADRIEAP